MKVYIAHSRGFDYKSELYRPIRSHLKIPQVDIILPHEASRKSDNTRDFYASLDLMIAEVSYPATGLGIELGWAFDSKIPVACIYRQAAKLSGSLGVITDQFYAYDNAEEMLKIITNLIEQYQK